MDSEDSKPRWSCIGCLDKFADENSATSHSLETGHPYIRPSERGQQEPPRPDSWAKIWADYQEFVRLKPSCKDTWESFYAGASLKR